jgi:nucleotide-binding universal stress UspA family protein
MEAEMTSFKHVLVPVDFSKRSAAAIAQGASIAEGCDARLTVLYVASTLISRETRDDLMACVSDMVEKHPLAASRAHIAVVDGDPAREILEFTRTRGVDLLILGARRRDAFERLFVPSVSETVLREAPCSVLAIGDAATRRAQTAEHAPPRVLCAVDLSPTSLNTLQVAAELARSGGRALTVLHVIDPAQTPPPLPMPPEDVGELSHKQAAVAYERLDDLVARAGLNDVGIETLVAFGQIPNQIVGAGSASGADVIVLGGRSRHFRGRSFLRPTAREVLALAQRPILFARDAVNTARPRQRPHQELVGT